MVCIYNYILVATIHINKQTNKRADKRANKQTNEQTYKQTNKPTNKQTAEIIVYCPKIYNIPVPFNLKKMPLNADQHSVVFFVVNKADNIGHHIYLSDTALL